MWNPISCLIPCKAKLVACFYFTKAYILVWQYFIQQLFDSTTSTKNVPRVLTSFLLCYLQHTWSATILKAIYMLKVVGMNVSDRLSIINFRCIFKQYLFNLHWMLSCIFNVNVCVHAHVCGSILLYLCTKLLYVTESMKTGLIAYRQVLKKVVFII